MEKSILFIGKFDSNLLKLQERIINLSINSEKDKNIVKILKDDINIYSVYPDVIKFPINGYNYVAWTFVGNVKPTLLLKGLISKTSIILFVVNLNDSSTLTFLNEGWGPIFNRIKNIDSLNQKRFLVATKSGADFNQEIVDQIEQIFDQFNCERYFEYDIENSPYKPTRKSSIISTSSPLFELNIIDYLKTQLVQNEDETVKKPQIKANSNEVEIIDDDDEVDDNEKEDEKVINDNEEEIVDNEKEDEKETIKGTNSINYRLSNNNFTGEVVESPDANGDVFIPTFIEYKSKEYKIIGIRENAFKDSKISSLSFSPNSEVTRIGNFAFKDSTMKKLFIPINLSKLDSRWNEGCNNLNEIEIDENNRYFSNDAGFLIYEDINKSFKEIIFAPRNFEGQYIIPGKIMSLGRSAFRQLKGLKSFSSHNSLLQMIKADCFYQCYNLERVTFHSNNNFVFGSYCFAQSQKLSTVDIKCKELLIGQECFSNCSLLSSVNLIATEKINLSTRVFLNCSSLDSFILKVESASIKIGDECFYDSRKLKSIAFIGTSIVFGKDFIKNCSMLSFISIQSEQKITISSSTFGQCNLKTLKLITKSKLKLEDSCFMFSIKLENVNFVFDSIVIGNDCFSKCSSLKFISFKCFNDIKVNDKILSGCNSLQKLVLASDNHLTICDKFLKGTTKPNEIEINGRDFFIGKKCFTDCESITIKGSIINLSEEQFYNFKSLKRITIESDNQITIGPNCFGGCVNIVFFSISGPNIVINDKCFYNCSKFNNFIVTKANNLNLGSNVFNKCSCLTKINLEVESTLDVGDECFNNSEIKEANFKGKRVQLGNRCFISHGFWTYSKIETVGIEGELVVIKDECFIKCTNLQSFFISSAKNVKLCSSSFEKCKNLKTVLLKSENKLEIMNHCFFEAVSLENFVFSSKEIIIDDYSFCNCNSIKSFNNENSDKVILGYKTFENCFNLEKVEISAESEFQAKNKCFISLKKLKTVKIISKNVKLGDFSFSSCSSLVSFNLPSVDDFSLYDSTFSYCPDIKYNIKKGSKIQKFISEELQNRKFIAQNYHIYYHC